MAEIETARTELSVDDGTAMSLYTAAPQGAGPFPGVIVFQEAFGVNAHIRDVTERFAREGFFAAAPELFHRSAPPGFESGYGDFEAVRPHVQALTTDGLAADARATFGFLERHPEVAAERIAACGFCLGGRAAYIANAEVRLAAAVSFYGGGIAPALLDRAPSQHGPLLMFWGGRDQHILPEHYRAVADALFAAGKEHEQVVFSFADHGFFCDRRESYDKRAAAQAWALLNAFLRANGLHG